MMKKILASLLFMCAGYSHAQIIDFAYHLTSSTYPLANSGAGGSGTITGGNCTNQVMTGITAGGVPTCSNVTGSVIASATVALSNMAAQAGFSFVMNNTAGSASPTAVSVSAAQQAIVTDTSFVSYRDDMCSVGGVFRTNVAGAGSITVPIGNTDAAHPCVVSMNTGTGVGDGAAYVMTDASSVGSMKLGGGAIVVKWSSMIATLSTAGNEFFTQVGFQTSRSSQVDGVWVEYVRTSSVNWRFCGSKASASSCSDTGVVINAGQWYKFELDINAAGTAANLIIDGAAVGTNLTGTNIPTAAVVPLINASRQAGNGGSMLMDYYIFFESMTVAR